VSVTVFADTPTVATSDRPAEATISGNVYIRLLNADIEPDRLSFHALLQLADDPSVLDAFLVS
jgi:hypothetical protein